ncbi:MAG TPA: helix-turn-helix transcriptional regulator [Gammaproteobacteria bacterium]|nr:helix-turn-helix transcriptional regulator [Gammaproteobacteria bacterium]
MRKKLFLKTLRKVPVEIVKQRTATNKKDFVKATIHCAISPGDALKMLRELQGLSQNDLAQLTGINQSNISAIEHGSRQIGRERAITLAKALHVHPAILLFPYFDMSYVA